MKKPKMKVLYVDIETAPILGYVWQIWETTLGLEQIRNDWHLLAFAAKWEGDPASKVIYYDQRDSKDIENDKELLHKIWKLLNEADIVIGQNSKQFDIKKLNARFILNDLPPYSSFKHVDTREIAYKKFGFTSNKLEYMSNKLCKKYKKLKHKKFPGFELWKECLAGNKAAWNEMKRYNIHDVLATEELYSKLRPWDNSINPSLYSDSVEHECTCGSKKFRKNGFCYTSAGKYQRYSCSKCGAESRARDNLFSKEKRKSIRTKVS